MCFDLVKVSFWHYSVLRNERQGASRRFVRVQPAASAKAAHAELKLRFTLFLADPAREFICDIDIQRSGQTFPAWNSIDFEHVCHSVTGW